MKVNNYTDEKTASHSDILVSNATVFYFNVVVYIIMSGCISVLGIFANVINIIVFIRQGIFTDSGSASLLGLSVSDLCCVTSMLWLSISFAIDLMDLPDLSWEPGDVLYLAAGWPHLMFAQITRSVTAYVALERCVCVVFPFKVKALFTPRRSIIAIACIFACYGLSYSPVFIEQQLRFVTDPNTNTTRLVLVSSQNWKVTVDIMLYVNSITFNVGSVVVVLVCTTITVSRVKLSKAWRESIATGPEHPQPQLPKKSCPSINKDDEENIVSEKEVGPQSYNMSKSKIQKEKKLVRMITSISIIFLISYSPDITYLIMFAIVPDIRILGKYENLALVMYSFTFMMETANSSINIFIYYKMSSKYKQDLNRLLGWKGF